MGYEMKLHQGSSLPVQDEDWCIAREFVMYGREEKYENIPHFLATP